MLLGTTYEVATFATVAVPLPETTMSSPSSFHQLLVELVEQQLEGLLPADPAIKARAAAQAWTPTKTELGSVAPAELRADLVMRLGGDEAPAHVVIVEVQMRWDEAKRWRWPHYYIAASDRYRCGVTVLVVTPTRQVAERCAPPAEFPPGMPWRPVVLGPVEALALLQRIPPPDYTTEARLLLVLLAGRLGGEPMAHHALEVIRSLDTASVPHYLELVDRMLSAAGRALFRSLTMNQLAHDNVWKHKNPLTRALLREGYEDGRRDGLRDGRRDGHLAGFREALLCLAASACSEDELATLRELPDVDALREAVHVRLGLPAPMSTERK